MSLFRVIAHIDASPARVWDVLRDWEGSAEWMVDATTVEVIGEQREGAGTRVRAVTKIAGMPLTDEMVVTDWVPERLLQVRHEKFPIIGPAWFALAPAGRGTRFEWGEDLRPPLGKLGELGGAILRTPIERVLAESLHKLKRVCESGG
ncbi:MAG TPA: SRPBCC family protein [Actinomycetota bacterium]|nr:SRPBCC family protein [Actinomycetota bacterium]